MIPQPLYLAELTAFDPDIAGERVLRFSGGTGYTTRRTDTMPDVYFEPRIAQPVNAIRSMFTIGRTSGRSQMGFGDLELLNEDGALDKLLSYTLDGRDVVIWRTEVRSDQRFPDDFTRLLLGTAEQVEFIGNTVRVKLRDKQYELSVPLQTVKHLGDNVLPNGLEGVATDLKGNPKPVCYGVVKNVAPPCVNTSKLIYQVNDAAVASVDAVYDRGVALTKGADYTTLADLLATAPSAGNFRAYPAGGYFRIATAPAGTVTADVTQGASAAERTAAQIYSQLITRAAQANPFGPSATPDALITDTGETITTDLDAPNLGAAIVVSGEWSDADLTMLDLDNPAVLGFYADEEMTVGEACDQIADTVGAWWGVDLQGVFRIRRFEPPTGTVVARFTANDLLRPIERLATNDAWRGVPVYRVILRWGKNYTPQEDLAAAVPADRRAFASEEWREVVATDLAVQERNLLSPETIEETLFTVEADALAEANRRLGIRKVRRDRFELVVPLTDESAQIEIGDEIELYHSRFGLNVVGSMEGKPFIVIGTNPDAARRRLTLNVWGSTTGREGITTDTGEYLTTDTGEYVITGAE